MWTYHMIHTHALFIEISKHKSLVNQVQDIHTNSKFTLYIIYMFIYYTRQRSHIITIQGMIDTGIFITIQVE